MKVLEARAAQLRAQMDVARGGDRILDFPVFLEPPLRTSARESGRRRERARPLAGAPPPRAQAGQPVCLGVRASEQDEFGEALARQLLIALSPRQPLAFELIGFEGRSSVQIAGLPPDIDAASRQMAAHYRRAELVPVDDLLRQRRGDLTLAHSYRLRSSHIFPIKDAHNVEPHISLLGSLAGLGRGECGLLQVLFVPVARDWRGNTLEMSRDPWEPSKSPFLDVPHLPRIAQEKIATPLFAVAVRLAASRRDILERLQGSFLSQFDSEENGFLPLGQGYPIDSLLSRTSLHHGMILNAAELASLVHVPDPTQIPQGLEAAKTTAPPPRLAIADILVSLGINRHRGMETEVGMSDDWLSRHVAIFGATGSGKTTALKTFFVSVTDRGRGVAFLDPAGDAAEEFLDLIPRHRVQDVVYFNPGDREWPPALNVLESSERDHEMLTSELMVGLERLFRRSSEFGPRMKWILRQALLTLLASEGEKTLRDVPRLLGDEDYRQEVLESVSDPDLLWFWGTRAPFPASVVDPILSRLSAFLDRPTIRNIVAQPNLIDFHQIMRQEKILICNLSKGILGEDHSSLLGSFILSKLQLATMARAEVPPQQRRLFVIIVDEFQNYAGSGRDTASIRSFLSEARKYNVPLVPATQYAAQLDRDVLAAVFGNVGTLIGFRAGVADAQALQRELGMFTADDLLNLETGQALVRMGRAASAFNVDIVPPHPPLRSFRDEIVDLSRRRYCRPLSEVEASFKSSPDPAASEPQPQLDLEPDEVAFMHRVATHPEETVTAVCAALEFSGSKAARVRRRLQDRHLTVEVDTRLGRRGRRARYAVLTREAYEALGEEPPRGRGGPVHKHFVEIIARHASDKGYEVSKEHPLQRGWVDLHLERGGMRVAIEVSISSTAQRELANTLKCLDAQYQRVLVLFLDQAVLETYRELLLTDVNDDERNNVEAGNLNDFHRLL